MGSTPGPRVLLVRHGETRWSRTGRHTGHTDVPLTDEGREMARRLGRRLAAAPWNGMEGWAVRTSPLSRARETCEIAGFGDRAQEWDALMEWDYGDDEGLTTPQIAVDRPGWTIWRDGIRGGETLAQVAARADKVVDWVKGSGTNTVIFAHGHFLRTLAARWLLLDPQRGQVLRLDPASISVMGWEYGEPAVRRWNDSAHLEG